MMEKERFELIKKIFQEALNLDPGERDDFLEKTCQGDSELLTKVKRLLQRESESKSFLESPAVTSVPLDQREGRRIGTRIGQYLIKRVISSGGMGTVYEAVQQHPERSVAVKVMNQGLASQTAIRRFEYEAQILARLRHPNIAQIIEAGTFSDKEDPDAVNSAGLPYFVMEYIPDALPLTDYAREKDLPLRERLELFTQACNGVHHGHQKGIIHRDLKPGNILVDSEGQVKIIDFGVARATDSDMAVTTIKTEIGQLIGTLQYMSPEQCEADPHNLDVRSDVYALGVVLYELLCEELPYDVRKAVVFEAVRLIKETPPKKPSTTKRYLSGDVETIVLKALEKERAHRYQSMVEFAADIDRYLTGRVILARPAGVMTRTWKYARRNPVLSVAVGSTLIFLIVFSLYIILWSYPRLQAKQADLEKEMASTEMINSFLDEMLTWIDPIREGHGVSMKEMLDRAAERLDQQFPDQPLIEASLRRTLGITYKNHILLSAGHNQLEQALTIYQRYLGINHVDTLTTENLLVMIKMEQGLYETAEPMIADLMERCERMLGADHPETLNSMERLAWLRNAQERYEEAESLFLQLIEKRRYLFGEGDRKLLSNIYILAMLYGRQDRFEEAETILTETYEKMCSLLGDDHLDTLSCQSNLASLYDLQGRYKEAEANQLDILAKRKRSLGPNSYSTLKAQGNLASTYYNQGKFEEAEKLYLHVLDKKRRLLGGDHPDTLLDIHNLAVLYIGQARYEEAEPLIIEAIEGRKRVLGTDHPNTLTSMSTLASLYLRTSRYKEAEPLFEEALKGLRKIRGEDHTETILLQNNLLRLYSVLNRNEEAEPLQKQCLEKMRRLKGDDHPDTLTALVNLATIHQKLGRFEEAEEEYLKALKGWKKTLGEDHPNTLAPLNNLATLYAEQKRYDEAETYFLQVLESLHRLVGENHPNSLTTMSSLAVIYQLQGRAEKAESLYLEAIEKSRQVLGEDHFTTLNALGSLGSLYVELKRFKEAEPHLIKALEGKRSMLGDEHPHTIKTIVILIDLYEKTNRFEEALPLAQELVECTPEDSELFTKRKEQLDRIKEHIGQNGPDR